MDMLEKISRIGITVVAVIHQPRVEIFNKFDDVLMIAPGGRTAYLGPTADARAYFENLGFEFPTGSNDADILMDILSGQGDNPEKKMSSEDIANVWVEKNVDHESLALENNDEEFHQVAPLLAKERGASFMKQLWYSHNLSIIQQIRNASGIVLEIAIGLLAGFVMGLSMASYDGILYQGLLKAPLTLLSPSPVIWLVPQVAFLFGLAIALSAAAAGVKVFSEEVHVYWRYTASGHNTLAYYLGKTISSFYRIVLASLHFSGIYYVLAIPVTSFLGYFWLFTLMYFGVYGMSTCVAMLVRRENAALLATVVALFASATAGYGITLKKVRSLGIYFLWTTQFNMWGAEALFSETLRSFDHLYDNDFTNFGYEYTFDRVVFDYAMMFVIGIGWRMFAYILMIFLNREKQR